MKKYLLSLAALCLTMVANAQILDFDWMPPYKLGVVAGVNIPTFSGSGYEYTIGTHAGIDLMIDASDLIEDTYLRTQLKYSMKGATGKDKGYVFSRDNETSTISTKKCDAYYTTHYIELPVHYGYSWLLDDDWSVVAETGPYFALGLAGTERLQGTSYSDSSPFFHDFNASRFDFGWGIQAGILFEQSLMLNIGYDMGFMNMTSDFLQNRNFSVGLTYFIE